MSGKLSALSLEEMEMAWWGVCYCDFPNAGSMGNETCGCIVCGKDPHYDDGFTPNEMEQYVECAGIGPVQLDCGCTPDWDEFCPYCADVSPANIG